MLEILLVICVASMPAWAFLCMWFYRRGVKDGRRTEKNQDPEPIIKPKPAPVGEDAENLMDRFEAILNYDPYGEKV